MASGHPVLGGPVAASGPGMAGGPAVAVRRAGRTAADTRARILAAATAEFADRGLAGGRVDRIAAAAEANKERIYANFGSKEGLFDATVEAIIGELLDSVPF
ncbi:MAG TPA: TetR/AcrR family transcriptional regulator, partial [Nakamurella sp.]